MRKALSKSRTLLLLCSLSPLTFVYAACSSDDSAAPAVDAGPGAVDAARDAKKVPVDTGTNDLDASTCSPGDVSTFVPNWTTPIHNLLACSDVQIAAFVDLCINGNTTNGATCATWQKDTRNATCNGCISTAPSAQNAGAVVARNGYESINVGGCIANVLGDPSSTGCGAKYEADQDCTYAACETNCPIDPNDQTTFTAFQNCTSAAGSSSGVCKTYLGAMCNLADAGAAVDVCTGTGQGYQNFGDFVAAVAPIFCGGYTAEAGVTDASSDAAIPDAAPDATDAAGE